MAPARHNLTRRALLGAGAVLPLFSGLGRAQRAAARLPSPFGLSPSKPIPPSPTGREQGKEALRQAQGERVGDEHALPSRWDRALAAFERAAARLAAFRAHFESLPAAAREYPACAPLEGRFDTLESARLAALRRLLAAPAPDLPALAAKIALTVDDQAWELTGAETALAALKADALRLCGG